MARKSRKNIQLGIAEKQEEIQFDTAIYVRLSKEDNGIDADSIENQIYMIKQFVSHQTELHLMDIFVDNGQTGTNFERPGFNAMLDAVRKGKIKCIVVKDLSRFGRNYLETGNYLEKIFPYLGVRFISVNDNFDSLHAGKNDALLVPLKSILHDTYAKDISKKVSTAIDIKKKKGKFMGKIPPYGYVRDLENRHHLVIHEERAKIIRQVFQWRLDGDGPTTIAHKLNDMKVPTQFQIRWMEGHNDGNSTALWRGSVIGDILKNQCYLGCIVERKSSNTLYQGKKNVEIPRSEWKLIENTHEAIIDRESFEQVQRLIENSAKQRRTELERNSHRCRTENILSGLVKCGICGGGIHRDGGYFHKDGTLIHYNFNCHNKYLKTGCCTSKATDEKELLDAVFHACKKQFELLADIEALTIDIKNTTNHSVKIGVIEEKIRAMEIEQKKLRNKRNSLYADWKDGLLTEKEYNFTSDKYATDSLDIEMKIQNEQKCLIDLRNAPADDTEWIHSLLEFRNAGSLTREMCLAMIDHIVVNGDIISIHFRFASAYEKAITFMRHCTESKRGGV